MPPPACSGRLGVDDSSRNSQAHAILLRPFAGHDIEFKLQFVFQFERAARHGSLFNVVVGLPDGELAEGAQHLAGYRKLGRHALPARRAVQGQIAFDVGAVVRTDGDCGALNTISGYLADSNTSACITRSISRRSLSLISFCTDSDAARILD